MDQQLPTIDEIAEKTRQANLTLVALHQELQQRRYTIFSRIHASARTAPTAKEKQELDKLEARLMSVDDAIQHLNWTGFIAVDQSDKIAELTERMKKVNDDLQDTIDALKRIQTFADTVAQLVNLLTQIGKGLVILGLA